MSGFVEQLFKMSLTASIVIVVVMLIRFLMRKFPKKYLYLLWATVWFRLLCPVSIESKLSIFNLTHKAGEAVQGQDPVYDPDMAANARVRMRMLANVKRQIARMEPGSNPSHVPEAAKAAERISILDPKVLFTVIWVVVATLILGYAIYHIVRLRKKLTDADQVEPGVYESPFIDSPIAIGIFRPGIYVPTNVSAGELEYLIEHERVHIRRGDLIFKMFAVIAVALHWFNPLAWIAFALFCRDMEMGCDEIVLEKLGDGIRKAYSLSLVTMAEKNSDKAYLVMPTSFGKSSVGRTEVKMRIENILHFKKSSGLAAAVAGVTVIGVGLACGLNAYADTDADTDVETTEEITVDAASATDDSGSGAPASQSEFMVAYPDEEYWESLDENAFAYEDYCIEDMSVIEDDDLRLLAQSYYDQGFYINNPAATQYYYCAPNDGEYMLAYGFHADSGDTGDASYVFKSVDVYRMDEDLFDYYILEGDGLYDCYYIESNFDEVTDDGTVIYATYTIDNFQYEYEFNRDTQIVVMSVTKLYMSDEDYAVTASPITDDLSVIEDETLRDIAQSYADQGCVIWLDHTDIGSFTGLDIDRESAFVAVSQDPNSLMSYWVFYMDQDAFDAIVEQAAAGDIDYTIEDDGTFERITFIYSESITETFEFNRDTGVCCFST